MSLLSAPNSFLLGLGGLYLFNPHGPSISCQLIIQIWICHPEYLLVLILLQRPEEFLQLFFYSVVLLVRSPQNARSVISGPPILRQIPFQLIFEVGLFAIESNTPKVLPVHIRRHSRVSSS